MSISPFMAWGLTPNMKTGYTQVGVLFTVDGGSQRGRLYIHCGWSIKIAGCSIKVSIEKLVENIIHCKYMVIWRQLLTNLKSDLKLQM